MNKKIFWTTLILFTLTLTACAPIAGTIGTTSSGRPSAVELTAQTKIVLGTINLEETDYAVTAKQAKELLPMVYVLQDLNDSDTVAQEEIDGLVSQIQDTMTDEQIKAIDDMSLSMRDVFELTQNNSGSTSPSKTSSTAGASTSGPNGGGAGGLPDMGGMPSGDPGGMPGGMPSSGTISASSSANAAPVMVTSTPSALFDTVIEILQKKVQ
jgi:hypothetical protein